MSKRASMPARWRKIGRAEISERSSAERTTETVLDGIARIWVALAGVSASFHEFYSPFLWAGPGSRSRGLTNHPGRPASVTEAREGRATIWIHTRAFCKTP